MLSALVLAVPIVQFVHACFLRHVDIARHLRKHGFSVGVHNKFMGNGHWMGIIDSLAKNADENTITVICYKGHGNSNKDGSYIVHRDEYIYDKSLLGKIASIPGEKILLVSSCQAGGFADFPANAEKGHGFERISVFSSTDNNSSNAFCDRKFYSIFKKAMKSGGKPLAEDFDRLLDERTSTGSKIGVLFRRKRSISSCGGTCPDEKIVLKPKKFIGNAARIAV